MEHIEFSRKHVSPSSEMVSIPTSLHLVPPEQDHHAILQAIALQ